MRDAAEIERITTPRLVLRCWQPRDAPLLEEAIRSSLPELRPWMPWALAHPLPVEDLAASLGGFRDDFLAGREWVYGIFEPDERRVLGGSGLHRRSGGPGVLEIGYWLRTDATGRGLVTEATAALTRLAFHVHGADRVEIRCDPRNERSAAVPRRLGFTLLATLLDDAQTPIGEPRDTMIFSLTRRAHGARLSDS